MKVITKDNVKQFIFDKIQRVYIGFDDNTKVKLEQISEFDIDLDKFGTSTIEVTNGLHDIEIKNQFSKNNHVVSVYIEAKGAKLQDCEPIDIFYDIPCDMKIRRLRINGDYESYPDMFIMLEGIVK